MTIKETEKLVKAINERMALYERRQLTDSYVYRQLQDAIRITGLPVTEVRDGVFRIARGKQALEQLTTEQGYLSISKINKLGGLKQEREKAKEVIKKRTGKTPKTTEVEAHIKNYGYLQAWVDNNLTSLYELEHVLPEAAILADNFDQGIRNISYEVIKSMISDFETARDKWKAEAATSKLAQETETPTLQAFGTNIKY